jgi:hypothetical protein
MRGKWAMVSGKPFTGHGKQFNTRGKRRITHGFQRNGSVKWRKWPLNGAVKAAISQVLPG